MDLLDLKIALGNKGPGELVTIGAEDLRWLLRRAEEADDLDAEVERLIDDKDDLKSTVRQLESELEAAS